MGLQRKARNPVGELKGELGKQEAKAEMAALHFILETRGDQERVVSQGVVQFVSWENHSNCGVANALGLQRFQ